MAQTFPFNNLCAGTPKRTAPRVPQKEPNHKLKAVIGEEIKTPMVIGIREILK